MSLYRDCTDDALTPVDPRRPSRRVVGPRTLAAARRHLDAPSPRAIRHQKPHGTLERNRDICRRVLAREPLNQIGRAYGISRQRVHHIVTRGGA